MAAVGILNSNRKKCVGVLLRTRVRGSCAHETHETPDVKRLTYVWPSHARLECDASPPSTFPPKTMDRPERSPVAPPPRLPAAGARFIARGDICACRDVGQPALEGRRGAGLHPYLDPPRHLELNRNEGRCSGRD